MTPWQLMETALVPGSDLPLRLFRRGEEFAIRGDTFELMNSRRHGSEETLARLACRHAAARQRPQVLIGGLGMGYTLAAALDVLGAGSRVEVAELVPAVVLWNRGHLGHLAGQPLRDDRVVVREIDIAILLQTSESVYDVIVLDVDNGPDGLTRPQNDWLYGASGLAAAHGALRPQGVLAVWSAAPDKAFTTRLHRVGFEAEAIRVPIQGRGRGGRHTIWIARRS
jgi:spermidine synthase